MTTISAFAWRSTEIKAGISSDVKVPQFDSIQGLPLLAPFLNLHSEDVKVLGGTSVRQHWGIPSLGRFLNLHAEDPMLHCGPSVQSYMVIASSVSFLYLDF